MSAAEIAAYLGALAWLPHIGQWIYKNVTKPTIRIIPDRTAQIGYTLYGPIFYVRLSIDVCEKDTVIDFIGVRLTHDDGSSYNFEWTGMNEIFSEVISQGNSNSGANQIVQKDVLPIAIKISTLSLAERFFRFQQTDFIRSNRTMVDPLIKNIQQAKKIKTEGRAIDFIWKEINDYHSFLKGKFIWKAGKYTISFIIRSPAKFNYIEQNAEFNLTQTDIDTLNSNLMELEVLKNNIENDIENPEQAGREINWVWVNPIVDKSLQEESGRR